MSFIALTLLDDDDDDDDTDGNEVATLVDSSSLPTAEAAVDAEILQYQSEPKLKSIINDVRVDPLYWWKNNATRFPLHAKLARKILAVPATSAPTERLFSTAGLTITKERSRL